MDTTGVLKLSVVLHCKDCCLGGFCHVSNNLHVCTTPQQHYSTSLLYEQGHTAEVLGKTVVLIGFRNSCTERIQLGKYNSINSVNWSYSFPFLISNTHIGFGSNILSSKMGVQFSVNRYRRENRKQHRKARYATITQLK